MGALITSVINLVFYAIQHFARRREERRRATRASRLASTRGWGYCARDDRWCNQFTVAPFRFGVDRQARNIITGAYGRWSFAAFDHVYRGDRRPLRGLLFTTATKAINLADPGARSHWSSVVALQIGAGFPRMEISGEDLLDRAADVFTDRDIELESEEFNRRFVVHCEDRRFAYDVLHPGRWNCCCSSPG
ncbi:MAG: hypothetical protein R2698_09885 [Microthrixaceae bacterium]